MHSLLHKFFVVSDLKLSNFIKTHQQHLPIAELVCPLKDQCADKNRILGKSFTRFVRCMNIYTNPKLLHEDRCHPAALRELYSWELASTKSSNNDRIELITTEQELPNDVIQSLERWKVSAPEIITKLSTDTTDPTEMVRNLNYALIGGYLQKYGMKNTLGLMDWLGVVELPASGEIWPKMESPIRRTHDAELQKKLARLIDGYEYIEQKLQYDFADKAYLLQSFSHETFATNDLTPTCRGPAWIGSAIANYAITRFLFKEKLTLDAEHLADAINLLDSNTNYGVVSMRNDFHKYVRHMDARVNKQINCFDRYVRRKDFEPINDVSK